MRCGGLVLSRPRQRCRRGATARTVQRCARKDALVAQGSSVVDMTAAARCVGPYRASYERASSTPTVADSALHSSAVRPARTLQRLHARTRTGGLVPLGSARVHGRVDANLHTLGHTCTCAHSRGVGGSSSCMLRSDLRGDHDVLLQGGRLPALLRLDPRVLPPHKSLLFKSTLAHRQGPPACLQSQSSGSQARAVARLQRGLPARTRPAPHTSNIAPAILPHNIAHQQYCPHQQY